MTSYYVQFQRKLQGLEQGKCVSLKSCPRGHVCNVLS